MLHSAPLIYQTQELTQNWPNPTHTLARCSEDGHTGDTCTTEGLHCEKCGRKGHVALVCRNGTNRKRQHSEVADSPQDRAAKAITNFAFTRFADQPEVALAALLNVPRLPPPAAAPAAAPAASANLRPVRAPAGRVEIESGPVRHSQGNPFRP